MRQFWRERDRVQVQKLHRGVSSKGAAHKAQAEGVRGYMLGQTAAGTHTPHRVLALALTSPSAVKAITPCPHLVLISPS